VDRCFSLWEVVHSVLVGEEVVTTMRFLSLFHQLLNAIFSNKHEISLGYSSYITVPPAITCDVCLDWDASKDSELAYFKLPPKYPCCHNLIDGKYLKEKIITFKGFTNAWNRTHEELVSGIWEKHVQKLKIQTPKV
jgi:hypothetical protein